MVSGKFIERSLLLLWNRQITIANNGDRCASYKKSPNEHKNRIDLLNIHIDSDLFLF